ncbi:MAG: glycosyltransferase family 39 protein [Anaerolineae bacterium]
MLNIVRRRDWLPLLLLLLSLATHFAHFLSAPPGVSGDAARLGLYTLDFLQRDLWPFYIYHQFAPNPLIVYLQAPVFTVFGFTLPALRGLTAFGGALATPAVYLAGRELFAGRGLRFARRAGLMAALGLALSPFFGLFSRHGMEPPLLPVVELLAVASLWRGLRRGRRLDFFLAGVVIGLSQYTYIVGRVFPLALAAACGAALWTNRHLLARWRGLALAGITAALLALPQWLLFIRAPYTFVARTRQSAGQFVFSLPDPGPILGAKILNQLSMFGWRWDNPYNPQSSRPLLTPVLFLGLLVALGATVRARRAGQSFGLTMAVLLLLPDLLAFEGLLPQATRLTAALPFIFLMAGLGCAIVWGWLENRPRLPAWVAAVIPLAVVLSGLARQWDFAARVIPQVNATEGLEWRASLVEVAEAEYIAAHRERAILLPSSEYQRAPLAYLLAEFYPRRGGGWPPPLEPGETVTVVTPVDPERPTTEGIPAGYVPDEWVLLKDGGVYFLPPLPEGIAPLGQSQPLLAGNGVPAAQVFPARWRGASPAIQPLAVSFTNGLDLVGYGASELAPGQPLTVTLYWQPRRQIRADTQIFVQLLDRNAQALAGLHDWPLHGAYRIRAWQPGETMPLSYRLPLPPDLPPGPYRLIVGTFDLVQQQRIPLSTGEDFATVARFKVPPPSSDAVPAQTIEASFGDAVGLTGYSLIPTADGVRVTLFWQASAIPPADYTVFVHITDANGRLMAQSDAQPLQGQYPTSIWTPGEMVVEERLIAVPPGEYQVYVGLYQWETLERLPARLDGQPLPDNRLLLDSLRLP